MPLAFSFVGLLVSLIIIGVVLLVVGMSKKDKKLVGWGEFLAGLSTFAFPMLFYLGMASDEWETFEPTSADVALLGCLAFVGGMGVALGLRSVLVRDAHSAAPK